MQRPNPKLVDAVAQIPRLPVKIQETDSLCSFRLELRSNAQSPSGLVLLRPLFPALYSSASHSCNQD